MPRLAAGRRHLAVLNNNSLGGETPRAVDNRDRLPARATGSLRYVCAVGQSAPSMSEEAALDNETLLVRRSSPSDSE